MTNRRLIGSVALLALLTLAPVGARAEGEAKYPEAVVSHRRHPVRPDEAARPRSAGAPHARIPGKVRGGPR